MSMLTKVGAGAPWSSRLRRSAGQASESPILPLEMDGRRLGVGHRLPRIGEHTREILLGLGYAEAEIGRLVAEGICRA